MSNRPWRFRQFLWTSLESFRSFRGPLFRKPVHTGAFCQFPFRGIYYCHSSKSTGKETDKTHVCAVTGQELFLLFLIHGKPALITVHRDRFIETLAPLPLSPGQQKMHKNVSSSDVFSKAYYRLKLQKICSKSLFSVFFSISKKNSNTLRYTLDFGQKTWHNCSGVF